MDDVQIMDWDNNNKNNTEESERESERSGRINIVPCPMFILFAAQQIIEHTITLRVERMC